MVIAIMNDDHTEEIMKIEIDMIEYIDHQATEMLREVTIDPMVIVITNHMVIDLIQEVMMIMNITDHLLMLTTPTMNGIEVIQKEIDIIDMEEAHHTTDLPMMITTITTMEALLTAEIK